MTLNIENSVVGLSTGKRDSLSFDLTETNKHKTTNTREFISLNIDNSPVDLSTGKRDTSVFRLSLGTNGDINDSW